MLDPRIYRAGLIPALLALLVAAFSVQSPPPALTAGLPPDSFSGARATAQLRELARDFPARPPGSRGDTALAGLVRRSLVENDFRVRTVRSDARTARGRHSLETVIGQRTGLSSRRIVVVAHRDALTRPATAELSGTAALLELARVFQGRTLRKTLVLVSTSGGSGGSAGAAEAARSVGGSVDAVLVLGDLAGRRVRRPLVVPWSDGEGIAPFSLRTTVASAVRVETGLHSGDPGLVAQVARLAFPFTVGEQGVLGAAGLPAVLLSASGERGPGSSSAIQPGRLNAFGRTALRSVTALDARRTPPAAPRAELFAAGKLLPGWAVRLVVAALILPAVLAAVDGFARVRRRRHPVGTWVVWVLSGAIPFLLAVSFAWLLSLIGLIPTPPPAPAPIGAVPLGVVGAVGLIAVVLVGVVGWLVVRPFVLRLAGVRGDPSSPGAAAALALVLVGAVGCAWLANPFAALLLIVPLHGWMLLAAPELRMRRDAALALVGLTLLPLAVALLYYALALGAGPLALAWNALLAAIGGQVGLLGVVWWSVMAACLGSVLALLRAKRFEPPADAEPMIRGPLTYAGPGSLGGTESAIRR